MMGYSNEEIYKLSKKIISNDRSALFGEAYNISFTDIYDFSSEKKSLKKWEIEMASVSKEKLKKQGFTDEEINTIKKVARHQELGLSWDLPYRKNCGLRSPSIAIMMCGILRLYLLIGKQTGQLAKF